MTDQTNENAAATPAAPTPETTSFHFKATKDITVEPVGKDEAGNAVFADDGKALIAEGWKYTEKGWKRPSVEVLLPSVTEDDVIAALDAGGQVKQFILAITSDQFYNAARNKINDAINENKLVKITADFIKGFNLNLEGIAQAYLEEAASAKATGIAKEVWDDFVSDYVAVMLRELPTNGEEKIKNAAEHLKRRFQACRSNKPMITKLRSYLALWFAATSRQEEFAKLYKTLDDRAQVLLNTDDMDSI